MGNTFASNGLGAGLRMLRPLAALLLWSAAMTANGFEFNEFEAVLKAGDAARLREMIAQQPQPWPRSPARSATLLHHACSYNQAGNQPTMLGVLLEAGPEVDARDATGLTALYWAAGSGRADCVRLLLAAGAKVDARAQSGRTPLHVAAAVAVPLLLAAGADLAVRDAEGNVPLHGNWRAALLGPGIDVRNHAGFTPLHFAALAGDDAAIAWLLERGADPRLESTAQYRYKEGVLADEFDPEFRFEPGTRAYDLAKWKHERTKWSIGGYGKTLELLDAATPRRGWFRR